MVSWLQGTIIKCHNLSMYQIYTSRSNAIYSHYFCNRPLSHFIHVDKFKFYDKELDRVGSTILLNTFLRFFRFPKKSIIDSFYVSFSHVATQIMMQWCKGYNTVVQWLSIPQNVVQKSLNSGSTEFWIPLKGCCRFESVRISDNAPSWRWGWTLFLSKPLRKNDSSSSL